MIYNDIYVVIFDYTLYRLLPSDITFLRHLSCAQLRREGGKCPLSFLNFKNICTNIEKSSLQVPYLSA